LNIKEGFSPRINETGLCQSHASFNGDIDCIIPPKFKKSHCENQVKTCIGKICLVRVMFSIQPFFKQPGVAFKNACALFQPVGGQAA
jgi:hypothetical protein